MAALELNSAMAVNDEGGAIELARLLLSMSSRLGRGPISVLIVAYSVIRAICIFLLILISCRPRAFELPATEGCC